MKIQTLQLLTLSTIFSLSHQTVAQGAPSIGEAVDKAYTKEQKEKSNGQLYREPDQLGLKRNQKMSGVDSCPVMKDQKNFSDAIEGSIGQYLEPRTFEFPVPVVTAYQLPDPRNGFPTSLVSHAYCEVTIDSIRHMLGDGFVPSEDIVKILQTFSKVGNAARSKYWAEIEKAKRERRQPNRSELQDAIDVNFSVMGCISYEESLAAPGDQGKEKEELDQIFGEYLAEVPGIQAKFKNEQGVVDRPQGIMVYTDRPGNYVIELRELRAEAERLKKEGKFNEEEYQKKIKELKEKYKPWTVLGLFQFLPDGFGNIRTCIEDWNLKLATKDQCKIKTGSKEQVSLALLSPAQTFNSYCGVGKIAHANYSQINTSSPNGTDFHNILAGGTLKAPKDRCISLLSRAGTGRVYSHYGPLRNSVKDNLGKVMKCVAGALKLRGLWKQGDASVIVEEQNRRPQSEVDSAVLPKSAH